jgi:hypothetical protein
VSSRCGAREIAAKSWMSTQRIQSCKSPEHRGG